VFRVALRLARPATLFMIALVATACVGTAGAAPSGSSSDKPADLDRVVFRVSWEGGFVTPETILGRLPIVVVYADGRVVTQGPQIEIYPGPLMPNLQERTLSAAALDRLIELARDKDLLRTIHYEFPLIADAPDTVLEINLDGKSYRVSAYALAEAGTGIEPGADERDTATVEGRAALRAFVDALTGIPASDFVDEEHQIEPDALRIYAGKAVIVPNSELPGEQPAIDWPLGDLATAGEAVNGSLIDVRCQVVNGDDLATVLPLLQAANTLSTFRSEGVLYSLVVRPLLPGESGC
jgi:hypothetical protein